MPPSSRAGREGRAAGCSHLWGSCSFFILRKSSGAALASGSARTEELGAGSWSPDASRFAEEFVHFCWFGLRCCLFQLTVAVTESPRWEPSWGGAFPPSLPARGPPAAGADPPRARSPAGRRSAEPRLPATRDPCGRLQITISSPFQITISTRFQITMSSPFQIQFHRPFTPTVPAPRPALRHR